MSLHKDIIDAIADDLDNHAKLPNHGTLRYKRPRAIQPDDCPLLVVWLVQKLTQGEGNTTHWWTSLVRVAASWHEEVIEEAETLQHDEAEAIRMLDAVEKIETRVRWLSRKGLLVPEGAGDHHPTVEAWQVTPGGVRYEPPEMETGLVEGYAVDILVDVTEGPGEVGP